MPTMQAMTEKANAVFNRQSIGRISDAAKTSLGTAGKDLGQVCADLGIATSSAEKGYLSGWPTGLQEALRAAVDSAVARSLPVTFAWQPGYDYELDIVELPGTPTSVGGMTVILRSPIPSD
jgi:hypothetical protein